MSGRSDLTPKEEEAKADASLLEWATRRADEAVRDVNECGCIDHEPEGHFRRAIIEGMMAALERAKARMHFAYDKVVLDAEIKSLKEPRT
jgi:hypothetical protein